jgi:hypothetical protein
MVDDQEPTNAREFNPIEFIEFPALTKEGIKKEALKVLLSESALLKTAAVARNVGNAAASLEPELKAVAGSFAFIAKDVGNLFADLLVLASKALDANAQTSSGAKSQEHSQNAAKKPGHGT